MLDRATIEAFERCVRRYNLSDEEAAWLWWWHVALEVRTRQLETGSRVTPFGR